MADTGTVLEMLKEMKVRYYSDHLHMEGGRRSALKAYSLADVATYVQPDRRLSMGMAFAGHNRPVGIALRIQRKNGIAHRAAREFETWAAKEGVWSRLGHLSRLSIPARMDVEAVDRKTRDKGEFPVGGQPLKLGVSVSHPRSPAGSLGAFVALNNGEEGLVSASHVIANSGRVDLSDPEKLPHVYHPGSGDVLHRLTARHRVAQLVNCSELIDEAATEIDAAVARLLTGIGHEGNVIPKELDCPCRGKRIDRVANSEIIEEERNVAKVGRTTHYREGTVSAAFMNDVPLEVPGIGIVYYNNMIEIENADRERDFAAPGDSGALVFTKGSLQGIGLLVGGGEMMDEDGGAVTVTYSCRLDTALQDLGADWL